MDLLKSQESALKKAKGDEKSTKTSKPAVDVKRGKTDPSFIEAKKGVTEV